MFERTISVLLQCRVRSVGLLLVAVLLLGSHTLSRGAMGQQESLDLRALGPFLDALMVEAEVPGFGFALFDDSGTLYQRVGGTRNAATGEPVDANTAFEAASISKPIFAYVVYSLVRDGLFELEVPLQTLVDELPELGHDPRAADLTAEILLSHRGGLPNWRSRLNLAASNYAEMFADDDTLEFVADPGTGYRYSGEGYVLLQRIVEERTGRGLNELATARVFEPLGMGRSSFLLDAAIQTDYAFGHDREGNSDKWRLSVPLASSTLHTTATDLARFGTHMAGEVRSGGPYAALAEPVVPVAAGNGQELSWGRGLGIVTDGPRRYFFHGGNNVIFIADFVYGIEENLGYALLTNSSNGQRVIDAIELRVFGRDLRR